MTISRDLIREIRAMDAYDLRRLMMLIRGLLLDDDRPEAAAKGAKVTYRQESVKCGKQGCTRCPHGPYWYAYWREDGKTKSRYVGKELPQGAKGPGGPSPQ